MRTEFQSAITWPQETFPTTSPHMELNTIYFQRSQFELIRRSVLAICDNISFFSNYGVE
jgi:hypothetical protein